MIVVGDADALQKIGMNFIKKAPKKIGAFCFCVVLRLIVVAAFAFLVAFGFRQKHFAREFVFAGFWIGTHEFYFHGIAFG